MKKIIINNFGADFLVKKNKNFFWDNYNLIFWKLSDKGFYQKNGKFKNNKWGIQFVYKVREDGNWEIPFKYVKYFQ